MDTWYFKLYLFEIKGKFIIGSIGRCDMRRSANCIAFLFFLFPVLLISSCKDPPDEEPVIPTFPPLSDVIPYDTLGEGKLVFQRIGPMDNAYSGIYVLDVSQQKAWGISDGDLDGPAVSPDGQKIVFTTYTNDETAYDVYIMGIDGAYRERISNIPGQEHIPCWNPTGSKILYLAIHFDSCDRYLPAIPCPGSSGSRAAH